MKKVTDTVADIAATEEHSAGIDQINRSVNNRDTVNQQNASPVEESAAAANAAQTHAAHHRAPLQAAA